MALIDFRNGRQSTWAEIQKRKMEVLPQTIAVLEKEIETGCQCDWNYDKGIRVRKKKPLSEEDIAEIKESLKEFKEELEKLRA